MRLHCIPALIATLGLAMATSGCSNQCKEIRTGYEESLASQSPFEEVEGLPVHLGMALRTSLINSLVDITAKEAMKSALSLTDQIPLAGGKHISIKTKGDLIDIDVAPHPACENCLQFGGKLNGKLDVKVPGLPVYHVPLRGTASFVAPLEFEKTARGAAVVIDAAQVGKMGKSTIQAEIAQLPPTWTKLLRRAVSDKLLESVGSTLGKIRIFEFTPPNLGIDGLDVIPAKILTDVKGDTVWLGFSTNLRGAEAIELSKVAIPKQNFAMAADPSLIVPAVEAAMRAGKISRTYSKAGKTMADGPIHVTVASISVDDSQKKSPYKFGFRLWNMPSDDTCYWVDAEATGNIRVENNEVRAGIEGVELTDSSMSGLVFAIAKWSSSSFLEESREILNKSFAKESFSVPGAELSLSSTQLSHESNALILRANLMIKQ